MSVFETLYKIDVSDHIEKKNKLSYLSWAWAWSYVKSIYPDAQYTVYENEDGWIYHTDGKTAWVKTGVTINGLEHIEYLYVMDFRNQSIPLDKITSKDINTAIQRSITKALARHGLGLSLYAGEDLPEENLLQDMTLSDVEKYQKQILALADGNGAYLNAFIRDWSKGQYTNLNDLPLEKLSELKVEIVRKKKAKKQKED